MLLIYEVCIDEVNRIKQCVTSGRDSGHNHVMLEVALAIKKHTGAFKLNLKWMKIEDFVDKIKAIWKPFNDNLREFALLQFQQN
jgi:hypothetical protein